MYKIRYLIQYIYIFILLLISILQYININTNSFKYKNFLYKYETSDVSLFRDKNLKLLISNYTHAAMIIVINNKTYILESSYINGFELIRLDKIEKSIFSIN